MLLPGPDLHRVLPLALWDFCNIFLSNTGENQKKVLPFERGLQALSHYVKSVPDYCITFMDRLNEGLS